MVIDDAKHNAGRSLQTKSVKISTVATSQTHHSLMRCDSPTNIHSDSDTDESPAPTI